MSKVCRTENPFTVVETRQYCVDEKFNGKTTKILKDTSIIYKRNNCMLHLKIIFRLVPPPTPSPKPMFNAHKIDAFFLKLVGLRSFIEA